SGSAVGTSCAAKAFSRSTTLCVALLGQHGGPRGVELLEDQPAKRLWGVLVGREPRRGRLDQPGTGQAQRVEGQRILLADDSLADRRRPAVPHRQQRVE